MLRHEACHFVKSLMATLITSQKHVRHEPLHAVMASRDSRIPLAEVPFTTSRHFVMLARGSKRCLADVSLTSPCYAVKGLVIADDDFLKLFLASQSHV